jgi:predicted metal-dependent phosphotriesterase family hydrolase
VARVVTVRGVVDAGSLGVTMPHEHLLIDGEWVEARHTYDLMLDDEELAIAELADLRNAGGTTLCEVTPLDAARSPVGLRRISEASGITVVMGTGWYRQPYYPPCIDELPVERLSQMLMRDIIDGQDGVRPGLIGEIGSHKGYVTAQEERVFRAAAMAAVDSGLSVTTHSCPDGRSAARGLVPVGLAHLAILEREGLDPGRIAIGHVTTWMHLDYHLAIVERGAYAVFDGIGATSWLGGLAEAPGFEDRILRHVTELVERGHLERVLLSEDLARKSQLTAFGGKGYGYLLRHFVPRLQHAGLSASEVATILVDNPRRLLSVQKGEAGL